jgi:ParB-like chromosome segregation protein Spo0J
MLPPAAHIPLALCDIDVPEGRRDVDPNAVKRIAESIESIGLRHAISVRPQGERYLLVAGRHRLEAYKALDKDFIPAVVTRFNKLEAELWEIDDCRNDLSPAELAAAIARRKTVHVQLNGSPKSKGAHAANAAMGQDHDATAKLADAFTSETSMATGRSERTIQRDAQRGAALGQEMLAKVARTSLDSGQELDALAQLSIESREALVERATAGEKVSARAEFKKEHRAKRERELGERQQALPETKYGVIVADPEWHDEVWSEKTGMDRHAANHYPTSANEVIASRPVADIAARTVCCFSGRPISTYASPWT